jgi:hypothetical protein
MQFDIYDLKKHWSHRIGRLQRMNAQNERFNIGRGHSDIRFRLTQLSIKFKL